MASSFFVRSLSLLLCLFALHLVNAATAVHKVTAANIESVFASNDLVILKFCTSWNTQCQSIAPDFEAAAAAQYPFGKVYFGAVDAQAETQLRSQYNIWSYPYIVARRKDDATLIPYKGRPETKAIVNFVKRIAYNSLTPLKTSQQLDEFLYFDDVAVVAYFDSFADSKKESYNFNEIAKRLRSKVLIGTTTNSQYFTDRFGLDVSPSAVLVFKRFENSVDVYQGDYTMSLLSKWVTDRIEHRVHYVHPENVFKYLGFKVPGALLFVDTLNPPLAAANETNFVHSLRGSAGTDDTLTSFTNYLATKTPFPDVAVTSTSTHRVARTYAPGANTTTTTVVICDPNNVDSCTTYIETTVVTKDGKSTSSSSSSASRSVSASYSSASASNKGGKTQHATYTHTASQNDNGKSKNSFSSFTQTATQENGKPATVRSTFTESVDGKPPKTVHTTYNEPADAKSAKNAAEPNTNTQTHTQSQSSQSFVRSSSQNDGKPKTEFSSFTQTMTKEDGKPASVHSVHTQSVDGKAPKTVYTYSESVDGKTKSASSQHHEQQQQQQAKTAPALPASNLPPVNIPPVQPVMPVMPVVPTAEQIQQQVLQQQQQILQQQQQQQQQMFQQQQQARTFPPPPQSPFAAQPPQNLAEQIQQQVQQQQQQIQQQTQQQQQQIQQQVQQQVDEQQQQAQLLQDQLEAEIQQHRRQADADASVHSYKSHSKDGVTYTSYYEPNGDAEVLYATNYALDVGDKLEPFEEIERQCAAGSSIACLGVFQREATFYSAGTMNFIYTDGVLFRPFMEKLGATKLPALVILDWSQEKHYVFDEEKELTHDTLSQFFSDYLDHKLEHEVHSAPKEEAAATAEGLLHVVADDFSDLVLQNSKNVLVNFHLPWCGFSKAIWPEYVELAKLVSESDNSNVVIADYDSSVNDAPRELASYYAPVYFPHVVLFRGADKAPVVLQEDPSLHNLLAFLRDNVDGFDVKA